MEEDFHSLGRIAVAWSHGELARESIVDGTVIVNYMSFHKPLLARIICR